VNIQTTVSHETGKFWQRIRIHREERMPAAAIAQNRAMASARAQAARLMQPEYGGLKVSELKKRMRLKRASRVNPEASITFSGRRIAVYDRFGMRARGRFGVRFGRLPWRMETIGGEPVGSDMLARAFRQRGSHGRAAVLTRLGKARYPITVLVAPGVARALDERGLLEPVRLKMQRSFDSTFAHEMERRLARVR
jgi:hypothetical protein